MPTLSKTLAVMVVLFAQSLGVTAQAHQEAEIEAKTTDGRMVLLKVDHTWQFIDVKEGDPARSAVLTVTKIKDMKDACELQVRMQNNMGVKIRSLVPRFSVYNDKDIVYDTKSKSFTSLRPTADQYKYVQFTGIGCQEIKWVRVHDAANCTMGDIDMFNEKEGQCLSHIYVEPSDKINISK